MRAPFEKCTLLAATPEGDPIQPSPRFHAAPPENAGVADLTVRKYRCPKRYTRHEKKKVPEISGGDKRVAINAGTPRSLMSAYFTCNLVALGGRSITAESLSARSSGGETIFSRMCDSCKRLSVVKN